MKSISSVVHGPNHKWWALSAIAAGILMSTIDTGSVGVTLPTIMAYFNVDVAVIQWVILAPLLTITMTLLAFGRLADIRGRKYVYTIGLVIYTIGSAVAGMSASIEQLIALRVIQAFGASMLMANGMAITSAVFPTAQRGMALGIMSGIVATGITLGPTVGGALTQWLGWRSVFYANLPLGVIGVALAILVLRNREITPTLMSGRVPRFDFLGAATCGVSLLALMVALAGGKQIGLAGNMVWTLYGIAALFFVVFILVERRISEPIIDLSLFRRPLFAFGSAAALLSFLAIQANTFLLPFYLQLVLGYRPAEAGLLMIPNSLIMVGVAPLSGWISDRLSARLLSSAGLGLVCVALLGLSRLGANSVYSDVLLMLLLLGLGQGLFQSPNTSSIFGSVPRERYGTASGFISMMRNLGSVTGVALASNLLMAGLASTVGHVNISALAKAGVAESGPVLAGFISGMERAYLLAAALAAFGVLASLSRGGTFGRERVVAPQAQSQAIAPAARSTTSPAHRLSSTDGSAGPDTTDG